MESHRPRWRSRRQALPVLHSTIPRIPSGRWTEVQHGIAGRGRGEAGIARRPISGWAGSASNTRWLPRRRLRRSIDRVHHTRTTADDEATANSRQLGSGRCRRRNRNTTINTTHIRSKSSQPCITLTNPPPRFTSKRRNPIGQATFPDPRIATIDPSPFLHENPQHT